MKLIFEVNEKLKPNIAAEKEGEDKNEHNKEDGRDGADGWLLRHVVNTYLMVNWYTDNTGLVKSSTRGSFLSCW